MVIFRFTCPGCAFNLNIGKTDRCLSFKQKEDARREEQPLFKHLANCVQFRYIIILNQLLETFEHLINVNLKKHVFNAVHSS